MTHVADPGRIAARSHEQWRQLLAGTQLPTGIVDLDAYDANADRVAQVAREAGTTVRLATKSIRVPALVERALERGGDSFRGLMCFAAGEAKLLASLGHDDLLVAYPTVQAVDLAILRELHLGGTRVQLVVDGVAQARIVDAAMQDLDSPFELVLDVDMSLRLAGGRVHLGVRRSPNHDADSVERELRAIAQLADVRVVGAMAYDAQVAGLGDRNPFHRFRNPGAAIVRRRSMRQVLERRAAVRDAFERAGCELRIFNGGGTGSLAHAAADPSLTEITAGSALACPLLFDYYADSAWEPSTFFALQAVREPAAGIVTCLGGGWIASGEAGADRLPRPISPRGATLLDAEGCGEVQTPVVLPDGARVKPGDPVVFRHAKAGELAEHVAEYLLVRGTAVIDRVPTYRGLGQCYL